MVQVSCGGTEKSLLASHVVTRENQLNVLKTVNKQTAVGPAFSKHVHFVNSEQKF